MFGSWSGTNTQGTGSFGTKGTNNGEQLPSYEASFSNKTIYKGPNKGPNNGPNNGQNKDKIIKKNKAILIQIMKEFFQYQSSKNSQI